MYIIHAILKNPQRALTYVCVNFIMSNSMIVVVEQMNMFAILKSCMTTLFQQNW